MVLVDRVRRFAPTPDGKQLTIAVSVGVLLRLAWGLWAARDVPEWWMLNGDQYSYWFFGNEIAHGRGVHEFDSAAPTAYYPIGYPALLGALYWLGLNTPLPDDQARLTAALHLVLASASIVLVAFITRRIFGRRAGLIAAWLMALYPSLIAGVATFSVETTAIFTSLLCVAILVDHDWANGPMSRTRLLWFGVAFGGAVLVRPFVAPMLLGLAIAAWLASGSWRSAARHVGWVLVTFIVVLVPWTVRNEIRFGHFIPISNNMGDTMCMSRYPGSNGGFAWARHEFCADKNLPEAERNTANTKAAIRFIIDHPGEELRQIPKRFLLMMANDHGTLAESLDNGSNVTLPAGLHSTLRFVTDWYYHITWILALGGIGLLFRGWRPSIDAPSTGPRKAIVGITALGLLLIPVMLWGNTRFHTPLVPFICIVAAASLAWLVDWSRRGTPPARGESPPAERASQPIPVSVPAV